MFQRLGLGALAQAVGNVPEQRKIEAADALRIASACDFLAGREDLHDGSFKRSLEDFKKSGAETQRVPLARLFFLHARAPSK